MDCNAIVVPYIGSITFIFFLLIPSCLALEPTNQTISPVALPTSGQLPLKENNNTNTGDIILTSPSLSAPPSIDAGPSVPAPHTHHHREILTSPKPRGKSLAIIIAAMLVAFFLMGIFSVYIRRCRVPETSQRNLHTGSNYGHSRSFYNGNLSFPFAARQQLLSGEDNRPQQHGLDLLLVSSLPTLKFSRGKGFKGSEAVETGRMVAECAVCLNEFEEGEELRYLPKCGHSFHQECIDMWLLLHTTCPLCRRSLLYDMNDHARPTMSNESIADSASPQALNRDVHEPLSDVQPLGYLADSRRTGVVSPLDRHDVTRLPQYRMRRSHSTGHYLYMYPPPPSSSQWIDLQCRNQLGILQATINAQGPKTSYATSSRPPPHNKLGCATWFRPRPGSESGRAACIRPFIGSQSGDAGWSRPMLDSELECATWNRPMPGNKLGSATENGAMSGNDSSCATWSPPAPYHKAHSCNVLLDLQAMRRELQDASPNRPTIGSQSGDAGWSRPMLDSELDGATWSRPMPGNKLGRATQNGAMSGNKSSCATTCSPPLPYHKAHSCNVLLDLKATRRILQDASPKRPMLGSQLGDARWNRSILGSESNRAAWIQPIPVGNKAGCTTWSRLMPAGNKSARAKQNGAMSGNESSGATWSSPAPYHKAHSCNVLLDLQAMRKALQDASPS